MAHLRKSLDIKFARAIQREYSKNSDDWSLPLEVQKDMEKHDTTRNNIYSMKKTVQKTIPISRQNDITQGPAIPVQKIVEPLTNTKRVNGCYIHSAIACTLPSIGLIPPSERSTCANNILNGEFDYEGFTNLHNYGTGFGAVSTPMLYIANNLYKDKESKTQKQTSHMLTKKSQFTLYYDDTCLSCTKLDEATKQYFIEMVHLPEIDSKAKKDTSIFNKDMLERIQEKLKANVVVFDFARSMESCPTGDDLLFKSIMETQNIMTSDAYDLNLYSIVLFSPTMSHFVTMVRDPNTNKWFLHTNALTDTMPSVIEGESDPKSLLQAICKDNKLTDDFIPCSCVYTSRFTDKKMNATI